MTVISIQTIAALALGALICCIPESVNAFAPARRILSSSAAATSSKPLPLIVAASSKNDESNTKEDVLAAAIDAMYGGGSEMVEEPALTRERIQSLVDENPVLLFMKGSKFFPQCGFSDTATKILETLEVENYETVDVLEDEAIREGIKLYSQWPTIPQLYIKGEFIGGSDIMMEMYEDGSLKKLLEDV